MGSKEGIVYIALSVSFIILAFGIYVNTAGIEQFMFEKITGKVAGEVAICIDQDIEFEYIPALSATTGEYFSYDVNLTYEANYTILNFTDNSSLFVINESMGLINFTPTVVQNGTHFINLTAGNNICNEPDDSVVINLTITKINHAPTLELGPLFIITEDTEYTLNITDNASDVDGDILSFYDNSSMFVIGESSGVLVFTPDNDDVGNHTIRFYVVDDGVPARSDFNDTLFRIVNVNDAPVLSPVGAQTFYINESQDLTLTATEVDLNDNVTFFSNTSWFLNSSGPLTLIGTTGSHTLNFNFTNLTQWNGTYSINITVNDSFGIQDSEVISFTIANRNDPPNITSYYPSEKTLSIKYNENQIFNITKYDPDGTTPSTMWFVDDTFVNVVADEYTFPGSSYEGATHNVTVTITDGEFNDSESWIITVSAAPLPPTPASGGAAGGGPSSFGGGRGRFICSPLWLCTDWSECSKANVQKRDCKDKYECGTLSSQPQLTQSCIYVEVPSCFDGVKNQDEVLPDCGGVCAACPTCDDGIQNQGEKAVDCGGPCPVCKEERMPSYPTAPSYPKWGLWVLMSLMALTALRLGKGLAKKGLKVVSKIPSTLGLWRVNRMLKNSEMLMKKKDYKKARAIYSKARKLYSKLPSDKQVKVKP